MTQLSERAMLVSLATKHWSARRHDKKISDEVAEQHRADADVGRYNKLLLARGRLSGVTSVISNARAHHYKNTLPWSDEGARILPAAHYFDYTQAQQSFAEQFRIAVADFVDNYPTYVAEARQRLNGMFSEADYPHPSRIARRFQLRHQVMPLPSAADFRVGLDKGEVDRIRADIEQRMGETFREATRDLWVRVHECVQHMHERLSGYGQDKAGKVVGPFRDTLVTNLRDLVELLPKLNVTGDPQLEQMRDRLAKKLCQHEPQELRDDARLRKAAVKEAADVLSAMAGYIAGPTE